MSYIRTGGEGVNTGAKRPLRPPLERFRTLRIVPEGGHPRAQ